MVVAPRSVERLVTAARLPLRPAHQGDARRATIFCRAEYVALRAILYPTPAPAMPGGL